MKFIFVMAVILGLGLAVLSSPVLAQACQQTIDLSASGGPKMVQCHEVTEMPLSTLDNMCRPVTNPQMSVTPQKLQKCPANQLGVCTTTLRTAQANIRRMQGQEPGDLSQIPEKAAIRTYFYEGAAPNIAEQCARSGGTWVAAKKAPAKKPNS